MYIYVYVYVLYICIYIPLSIYKAYDAIKAMTPTFLNKQMATESIENLYNNGYETVTDGELPFQTDLIFCPETSLIKD